MTTATKPTTKPTYGDPQFCDPVTYTDPYGIDPPEVEWESVGWDLSGSTRINFGPNDAGALTMILCTHGHTEHRAVTREQVIGFARHLLALVKGDDDIETIAATLAHTAATFERRIDERAEELAAPKVAAARAEVAEAEHSLTMEIARRGDLTAEFRRQIAGLEKRQDRLADALAEVAEHPDRAGAVLASLGSLGGRR